MAWVLNAPPSVNAESQYPAIIAVCIALSVVSVAGVLSRMYIRHHGRGLGYDDYMAALSMIFALAYSMLCIAQTRYGLGLPLSQRPDKNLVSYTRVNFAGRPIYQLGVSFFKIALLISYLRLLQGTDRKVYRAVVRTTIALIFMAHLGCALSLIFACSPAQKSWNPYEAGSCLAPGPSFTAYAVVTIVSDVTVVVLPVPMLLKLKIELEKKIGLIAIFALGLFTTLCSIFRYLQINRIQNGDGNSTMLVLWGVVEFNVGNLVSSLPFLAPMCARKAKGYRSKQTTDYLMQRWHGKNHEGNNNWKRFSSASNSRQTDSSRSTRPGQTSSIVKCVTYGVQRENNRELAPPEGLPYEQRAVQAQSYV